MKKQWNKKKLVILTQIMLLAISPCANAQEDILFKKTEAKDIEKLFDESNNNQVKSPSEQNIDFPKSLDKTGTIIIHSESSGPDRVYEIYQEGENQVLNKSQSVSNESGDILFKQEEDIEVNKYRIGSLDRAIQQGDLASLKFMTGFSINQETYNGNTIVHIAATRGNIGLLKFAKQRGANFYKKNKEGLNVVHMAAQTGQLEFLKELKNIVGQDAWSKIVKENDYQGRNPLHMAVFSSNYEVIDFLIKEEVFINQKDKNGMTPAFYSIGMNQWKNLGLFAQNGADLLLKLNEKEDETYEDVIVRRIPIIEVYNVINYLSDEKRRKFVETIDKIVFSFKDDERFKMMK